MTLFADISFTTEGVVAIGVLLSSLVGAIVVIFKLLMSSKDESKTSESALLKDQLATEREEKKTYKSMAMEAIAAMESLANDKRRAEGKPPMKKMAPVVPESNSPVTEEQQATSEMQTERARLTAVKKELEMPARVPSDPETIDQRRERLQKEILERTISPDVADKLLDKLGKVEEKVDETPAKTVEEFKKQEQSPPEKAP